MNLKKSPLTLAALTFFWLLAVGMGLTVMANYENTPGSEGKMAFVRPVGDHQPSLRGDNLLMFLHPQCPCSRASIIELSQLMTQCRGHLQADVFVYEPKSYPASWAKTDLWRSAELIHGVHMHVDENGREASRFGAETSGETMLYDKNGTLLYHGGITGARGHEGANAGQSAIVSLVLEGKATTHTMPVFGCPILPHGSATSSQGALSLCPPIQRN